MKPFLNALRARKFNGSQTFGAQSKLLQFLPGLLGSLQQLKGSLAAGPLLVVETQATFANISHLPCDELWNAGRSPLDQHLLGQLRQGGDFLIGQWTTTDLHEDAAHGPNIDLLRDLRLAVKELRRHIPWRTSIVLLGDVSPIHRLGEPKVANLDVETQIQHHVQGFQVAVNDRGNLAV